MDPAGLVEDLLRAAGLDPTRPQLGPVAVRPVAVGWATVDVARTAADLAAAGGGTVRPAAPDGLLGATVAVVLPAAHGTNPTPVSGPALVLLEPATEGRLAEALARWDEGASVLYLGPLDGDLGSALERLAAAGVRTTSGRGPFGAAAVIQDGRATRPLLMLVAVPSEP